MTGPLSSPKAAGPIPRRLFTFSTGFLTQSRLRRILHLAGHQIAVGWPGPTDAVVVWGNSATARRGIAAAHRAHVPLVRVEDAFLRSLRPGRLGEAPLGLLIDPFGLHYNARAPSLIEHILSTQPLTDSNLLARADTAIARLQHLDISKYNMHQPKTPIPEAGFVLVIDQTKGDASLRASGADQATFDAMLARAKADHPTRRIVLKSHPDTAFALRAGHYGPAHATGRISLLSAPVAPYKLLGGAVAVYTVSSQLGFEAILAGHRPQVFGTPFYAGWGLTDDHKPLPAAATLRRHTPRTAAQVFAAAMILAPVYYDPCRDCLCTIEQVIDQLEAETRAYRADTAGYVAYGMRAWKRAHLQRFFGRQTPVLFEHNASKAAATAEITGRSLMVWAGQERPVSTTAHHIRVEDGVVRSRGLGAALIPPLSLVTDDQGIYYDPTRPSQLEQMIAGPLPPGGADRVERLINTVVRAGISKYNLARVSPGPGLPALPSGRRILVPGQVEDDASLRFGAAHVRTNLALLRATRAANPDAVLIYKPHPDVEAGLRPGAIAPQALAGLADAVMHNADPAALLAAVDEVWTMTSTLGFEALLRGIPVTCLGLPFYAGWGLTTDLATAPEYDAGPDIAVAPDPAVAPFLPAAPDLRSAPKLAVAQNFPAGPDRPPEPDRSLATDRPSTKNSNPAPNPDQTPTLAAASRPNPNSSLHAAALRRKALAGGTPVSLHQLAHATLIAYPRYVDPVSRRPCPPEVALDRLINGPILRPGLAYRSLAKLQGHFAGFAYLWR